MEHSLFSRMRARVGGSLGFLFVAWEATKWLLDWGGRYQLMKDTLPHALRFLSEPWVSVVVFLVGGLLIWWAHYDIKHSHDEPTVKKRIPLVSLALFIFVGALFGSIAGFGIWVWTRPPTAKTNNNPAADNNSSSMKQLATDTRETKPTQSQLIPSTTRRTVAPTPHKDKTPPVDAKAQEIQRRYEVLTRLRDEYVLTRTGVSAGLLERKEYPPPEWINQRLRELGETWRFEDKDKMYRLSKYEAMTNQELQDETLKFVAELIDFNNQKRMEDRLASDKLWNERINAPKEKQNELSQRERTEYTTRHASLEAGYNLRFRGTALSLRAELRKRVPELAKTLESGPNRQKILLDYGMFAGVDPVGDAADYIDQLARGLPVK